MSRSFRAGFALALAAVALPVAPAMATPGGSVTDRVLADAAKYGVDARTLLDREIQTKGMPKMTVGRLLSLADGAQTRSGPAGTPEIQAGTINHFALTSGVDAPAPYSSVTAVSVPATPIPVAVVPATPVTSEMFVPVPNGPAVRISGSGFTGGHIVGGRLAGASTDTGGPDGLWLSGRSNETLISDSAIEFVGRVMAYANGRFCIGTYCFGFGFVSGLGTAAYDSPVALPALPAVPAPSLPGSVVLPS